MFRLLHSTWFSATVSDAQQAVHFSIFFTVAPSSDTDKVVQILELACQLLHLMQQPVVSNAKFLTRGPALEMNSVTDTLSIFDVDFHGGYRDPWTLHLF